jgi:hypothetical protein
LVVSEAVSGEVAESVPVPITVVPSLNVTVPVGVPVPEVTETVAVNVTDWPEHDGLADEVTTVEVVPGAGGLTV